MGKHRSRRNWFVVSGAFIAVFLFVFLIAKFSESREADAANMAGFDAGYIISDYQMGNYNSMNEAQIQAFLKSKNPCNDTATWQTRNNIGTLSESTPYAWHVEAGHYVCMADENFQGESAAHIIWQAAQDYRINPQVLIVLLQKEQGLVTDTLPNSVQYRSAMGFGCPDTAACSEKYYGFRNQVRNAAALFRTVLDGGWTNYPLGNNYVRYNPNAACGGTTVNIQNLATSALYRYTPYQPNAAALSSSYGGGDSCSAYGNRNFYSYFEDWFGGIKEGAGYVTLETPRYMELNAEAERINPYSKVVTDVLPSGMIRKFTSKFRLDSGEWCLRTEYSTMHNDDACVRFSNLQEVKLNYENVPEAEQEKIIKSGASKVKMRAGNMTMQFDDSIIRKFVKKTTFLGITYYITEFDYMYNSSEYGVSEEYLENSKYEKLSGGVQKFVLKEATDRINPYTGVKYDTLEKGRVIDFASKIEINGMLYYQTKHNMDNEVNAVVPASALATVDEYTYIDFESPREMELSTKVDRINPYTGEKYDTLESGRIIKFTTKVYLNGQWYYRTEHNTVNNINAAVPAWAVKEVK